MSLSRARATTTVVLIARVRTRAYTRVHARDKDAVLIARVRARGCIAGWPVVPLVYEEQEVTWTAWCGGGWRKRMEALIANVETVKVGDVLVTPHGEYEVVAVGYDERSGRMHVRCEDRATGRTWELRTGVGCSVGVVRRRESE